MTRVSLQVHALGTELQDLAMRWANEAGLHLAIERYFPAYEVVELDVERSASAVELTHAIGRVALGRRPFNMNAATPHQFASLNHGCLFVSVEHAGGDGLRESLVGGVTEDGEDLRLWRRLIRQARKPMHRGASIRNPATGATRPAPSHLHTRGAHDLAAAGTRMLAIAGTNEFVFDDCASVIAERRECSV
jgi:hypothetical protein